MKTILILLSLVCFIGINDIYGQKSLNKAIPNENWGTFTQNNEIKLGPGEDQINCQTAPLIKGPSIIVNWSTIEPKDNDFRFDEIIGDHLREFQQCGWKCYVMVWVSLATRDGKEQRTPTWLIDKGVQLVDMKGDDDQYPYYFNSIYKEHYWRMLDSLAQYLLNLPDDLRETVLFMQVAEGSTGDEGPYHGTPVDPKYEIANEQWTAFRHETWKKAGEYVCQRDADGNILKQIPFAVNPKGDEDVIALLKATKGPNAVIKEGGITHGYHAGGNGSRAENLKRWKQMARNDYGIALWSRGEFNEYGGSRMGWLQLNVPQGIYWSGLCGIHGGVNMWNLQYTGAIGAESEKNKAAIEVYNKYGGALNPETSQWAFCALRRGLDASDTVSWPEDKYGTAYDANGSQLSNTDILQERYENILADFDLYGATIEDMYAALKRFSPASRRRSGRNDVGWDIIRGNYERHLHQIAPEETSQAWWQVDADGIYGRFARSFDHANKKDTLFFELAEGFVSSSQEIEVSITFRNADAGKWALEYLATDGTIKTAKTISNTLSGDVWETTDPIRISDAQLNHSGPRASDFMLVNKGDTDCRFHMIEVEKHNKSL